MGRRRDTGHGYDFRAAETLRDTAADTGDPCARGNLCAGRDYQGNPARSPRPFCDKDRAWIVRSIEDLPGDYATIRDQLLPRSTQHEQRVSGSKEPPLPLAADVQAFMRELVHVAVSWEEHVRTANRLSGIPAERRRDEIALWKACEILAGHVDSLIALPACEVTRYASPARLKEIEDETTAAELAGTDPAETWVRWDKAGDAWEYTTMTGVEAAPELLALHGRARAMLGLNRQRRRITEVCCDSCGARSLFQREGAAGGWDPEVRCENCPDVYTGDRYILLMGRVYEAQVEALDGHATGRQDTAGAVA